MKTESQLRDQLLQTLRLDGVNAMSEVPAQGGRVDVVTPNLIIEIKKTLTRESVLQALGQLRIYQLQWPRHRQAIAGSRGRGDLTYVLNAARRLGVEVWFL